LLPELPAMTEGGLPGFVTATWFGLLAPAGTPNNVIGTLNAVIVKTAQNEEFRAQLAQMGIDPIAEPPEFSASGCSRKSIAGARW
jgi:tripartite-type tricarboxylate transporter receptor subunit TctC